MRHTFSVLVAASLVSAAAGQSCTPAWDTTIGVPGAPSGYVGALWMYQGDVIASGSFQNMAGAANSQYLARYNRGTNTWSAFPGGINMGISNAFGTSFATLGTDLYVGGFFSNAGGMPDTKSIARWDGSAFNSLHTGWGPDTVNAVWSMLATDEIGGVPRVYFGGGFDVLNGQPAGCIASWDGTSCTALAPTMTLAGINPLVDAITVFDDGQGGGKQLYIGGRFATVGALATRMIARWNGTTWSAVGTNLGNTVATGEIHTMLVYDDGTGGGAALYVGGINLRVNGTLTSFAKWNGLTWTAVGQYLTGRVWTMTPFDDGSGTKLYAGGTQTASGFIYRLEGNTWVTAVGGGVSAQVIRMIVDSNKLYVGGSFVTVGGVGGQTSNRVVVRTSCALFCECAADYNADGGVDGGDVGAFFADWEVAAGCSDVNRDGGINGSDVESFFEVWEAGGC